MLLNGAYAPSVPRIIFFFSDMALLLKSVARINRYTAMHLFLIMVVFTFFVSFSHKKYCCAIVTQAILKNRMHIGKKAIKICQFDNKR